MLVNVYAHVAVRKGSPRRRWHVGQAPTAPRYEYVYAWHDDPTMCILYTIAPPPALSMHIGHPLTRHRSVICTHTRTNPHAHAHVRVRTHERTNNAATTPPTCVAPGLRTLGSRHLRATAQMQGAAQHRNPPKKAGLPTRGTIEGATLNPRPSPILLPHLVHLPSPRRQSC